MADVPDGDSIGPVDVAIIHFEGNAFNGEIAPALLDLHDSGTVRIIDLAFVTKDDEGQVGFLEVADSEVAAAFDRAEDAQLDLLSDEDLAGLAEGLDPNCSAMVVVWENCWAAELGAAIRGSGGRLVAMERIPRDIVLQALDALREE